MSNEITVWDEVSEYLCMFGFSIMEVSDDSN
jgi:hypothetical protein